MCTAHLAHGALPTAWRGFAAPSRLRLLPRSQAASVHPWAVNTRRTRGEEVVGVEVEGEDHAKGGLPAQPQAAHHAHHLRRAEHRVHGSEGEGGSGSAVQGVCVVVVVVVVVGGWVGGWVGASAQAGAPASRVQLCQRCSQPASPRQQPIIRTQPGTLSENQETEPHLGRAAPPGQHTANKAVRAKAVRALSENQEMKPYLLR